MYIYMAPVKHFFRWIRTKLVILIIRQLFWSIGSIFWAVLIGKSSPAWFKKSQKGSRQPQLAGVLGQKWADPKGIEM